MNQAPMSQAPMSTDVTSDDKLWALLTYIFTPLVPIIILLCQIKRIVRLSKRTICRLWRGVLCYCRIFHSQFCRRRCIHWVTWLLAQHLLGHSSLSGKVHQHPGHIGLRQEPGLVNQS